MEITLPSSFEHKIEQAFIDRITTAGTLSDFTLAHGDTMKEEAGLYLNVKAVRGTEKIFNSGIYNIALTMTLRIQADDVGPQHWSEFLGYFEQIFEVNPKQLASELSNNDIHIYGIIRMGFNPGTMDMNREREYQLNLIAQNQKL